jgi:hypothetical protein
MAREVASGMWALRKFLLDPLEVFEPYGARFFPFFFKA